MIMNLSIGIAFVRSLPRAVPDSERELVSPRSLSPICESITFATGAQDGRTLVRPQALLFVSSLNSPAFLRIGRGFLC